MNISLYARVSTEEQKEGRTIESQIKELRDYAKSKSYEIVSEHFDDGWTGSILERPELDKLRDEAKNGIFEAVLIHHPDRLSRVQLHQLVLLDEFEKENIKTIFYKLPEFSEQSEEGRVVNKSVWSMVSELERLRIRERTRRGRRNKAEKGVIVGHKAPYGYKYVKPEEGSREGKYVINPSEAKIVKLIFALVKQGNSTRGVVKKLADLKISRRYPPKDRNKPIWNWATSTINKIIKNETYTGVTYFNKYESVEAKNPINLNRYKKVSKTSRRLRGKNEWIPISLSADLKLISKDDFDFVQTQLTKNISFSLRNTKHRYLLRGLLKCKECGCKYYADCSHGEAIYRDSNKYIKFPISKTCNSGQIGANIIDPLVWKAVTEAIQNPQLILKEAEIFSSTHKEMDIENKFQVATERLKNQEQRLLEGYREGIIDLKQLKSQMNQIKQEKLALDTENTSEIKLPVNLLAKSVKNICKELKKVINSLSFIEKQKLLRLLIDEVLFSRKEIIIKGLLPIPNKLASNGLIASTTSS